MSTRLCRIVALIAALLYLSGCALRAQTPWVQPYERARLADPIMSKDRDPASAAYLKHVHQSRERSRGAEGSAGGGCGCN